MAEERQGTPITINYLCDPRGRRLTILFNDTETGETESRLSLSLPQAKSILVSLRDCIETLEEYIANERR